MTSQWSADLDILLIPVTQANLTDNLTTLGEVIAGVRECECGEPPSLCYLQRLTAITSQVTDLYRGINALMALLPTQA